ncbi:MAG: hypothetical protein KME21_09865 [Desmonostoc vinosum HA7617-LM4]|jgi:hypothetical protein|nr:hypothetical protein [Desmonostoc vinosum HA7617-LM4]
MNLINFKWAKTIVAVIIAAYLFPESAQAITFTNFGRTSGIIKGSGRSSTAPIITGFNFNIDTLAANPFPGEYLNAIDNLNFFFGAFNTNSSFCGSIVCPSGNLKITTLTPDTNGNTTILDLNLNSLNTDRFLPEFVFDSPIRADVTLSGNSIPTLILLVAKNNSNLINDLSEFSRITPNDVIAIYSENFNDVETSVYVGSVGSFTVSQQVSEPTTTTGLLFLLAFLGFLVKKGFPAT